jgi:hypothetical protein
VGVGGWNAPELPLFPVFPVFPLDGAVVGVVLAVPDDPDECAGVVVDVGGSAGGLTLKFVPVTTVTCEPGFTCVGSSAMITAPENELATAWAAARSAGVFDA